jgi:beta-glucanase (GH16 family)
LRKPGHATLQEIRVRPIVLLLCFGVGLGVAGCQNPGKSTTSPPGGGGSDDGGAPLPPGGGGGNATTLQVTLRTTVKAKFVVAENGGGGAVNADRDVAGTWETFTLVDLDGGKLLDGDLVQLRANDGSYVVAGGGGGAGVSADGSAADPATIFRVVKPGGGELAVGGQLSLQTKLKGLFVSADQGGGGDVTADRAAADTWETFVLGAAPGSPPTGGGGSGGGGDGGDGTIPGWTLAWRDEFEGPAGAIDGNKWNLETGGDGFGNQELEFYTNRTDNVALDGQGSLVITTRRENFGGNAYTSGRINSAGHFTQAYGRFEARVQIPKGQGIWPAFWMLGANIGDVNWPGCGEIDIMENIGRELSTNHGSLHGPGYSGGKAITGKFDLPNGGKLSDGFHNYAVEWEPNVVRWYVDNQLYETRTPADLPAGARWVYDHPFFIILNVAVGGNFPGDPDGSTVFPQQMKVAWVRVYKR